MATPYHATDNPAGDQGIRTNCAHLGPPGRPKLAAAAPPLRPGGCGSSGPQSLAGGVVWFIPRSAADRVPRTAAAPAREDRGRGRTLVS